MECQSQWRGGARGRGGTIAGREHVDSAHSVGHHVDNHELWQMLKGEAMNGGTDEALNFANVAVGGNDVKVDWGDSVANAGKVVVDMEGAHGKASGGVETEYGLDFLHQCRMGAVWQGADLARRNNSTQRTALRLCSSTGCGEVTDSNAGVYVAVPARVVFPLRVAISGP